MLKNYLTVALRSLGRQPGYAAINVLGLAVGLACCVFIVLFIRDELSYDRFHERADRIYRVVMDGQIGDRVLNAPVTPAPMAATLVAEVPDVEAATRLFFIFSQSLVAHEDRQFVEDKFYYADSNFFSVFTFPFVEGDPATALREPNTVVLTQTTAARYFPGGGALGQTLRVNDEQEVRVTGIIEDVPANSHVRFDLLGSTSGFPPAENTFWVSNNFGTYLLLHPGADPSAVDAAFEPLMRKHAGSQIQQFLNQSWDEFLAAGNRITYELQPITDIHLHSDLEFEPEPGGDIAYVYTFAAVALFILLLACINFMNLATARSAGRAREVGMRKVLGSGRPQLIAQFLAESVLLALFALVLAVALVLALLPAFNTLAGKTIGYGLFASPWVWLALLGLATGVGLLAGSYPAFFLSSFQPAAVLKGAHARGGAGAWLRRGLVVFQFAVSIALIVATLIVYDQLQYVQSKNLGFDREHVVVVHRALQLDEQQRTFKEEVRALPGVVAVGASSAIPSGLFGQTAYQAGGANAGQNYTMAPLFVDHDWVETLGIEMAEGRDFARDFASDSSAFLLNEAGARKMGWTGDAVGRQLTLLGGNDGTGATGATGEVIGVMRDFHFASLHDAIDALAVGFSDDALGFVSVRVRPESLPATLAAIEAQWRAFLPNQPFTHTFLDEDFGALYAAEERLGQIFTTFAGFAILIACLGLFGLASFTAQQRTKEIGVRKVLGASVPQLIMLLSKEFTRLVAVAFVLAVPVGYLVMSRWLDDFAYRTNISALAFVVAGGAALAIAILTVSYQSVRAALADPVDSLRYE